MHHGQRGKPAFIFDLIEPERPKVDAAILEFSERQAFSASDFVIRKDGVCRLSPQLARAVAQWKAYAERPLTTQWWSFDAPITLPDSGHWAMLIND